MHLWRHNTRQSLIHRITNAEGLQAIAPKSLRVHFFCWTLVQSLSLRAIVFLFCVSRRRLFESLYLAHAHSAQVLRLHVNATQLASERVMRNILGFLNLKTQDHKIYPIEFHQQKLMTSYFGFFRTFAGGSVQVAWRERCSSHDQIERWSHLSELHSRNAMPRFLQVNTTKTWNACDMAN